MWTKVPRWTRRTGSKGGGLALSVTAYAVPERVSTLNGSYHKQIYNKKRNTLWKSTT